VADIPQPVAALLDGQRDALNDRFAARRRGGAKIEPPAFLAHVREAVAPLLTEVEARFPERAAAVLIALYDASLDLFAAALLGPETKLPAMHRVWTELLPNAVTLLAREPVSLVGCLCNAVFQVAQQRGTRPDLWLDRTRSALPHCQSVADVLDAGVVAAWQAGMPQFRVPALAAADRMKPKLATAVLGLPVETTAEECRDTVAMLKGNRWFRLDAPAQSPALSPVGLAGAFTGFGGAFSRPPTVRCDGGRLVVSVEAAHWQMVADAYGTWFRRVEETKSKPVTVPADVTVDSHGTVRWGRPTCKAPHLAGHTAVACDGETLAITIPTSHHVFLFARTGGAA
jgi:hypothetical protein